MLRLTGSVLVEIHNEWQVADRRYLWMPRWRSSARATAMVVNERRWEPTPRSCSPGDQSDTDVEDHAGALIAHHSTARGAGQPCVDNVLWLDLRAGSAGDQLRGRLPLTRVKL